MAPGGPQSRFALRSLALGRIILGKSSVSQVGMEVSLGGGAAPQCHPGCLSKGEILNVSARALRLSLLTVLLGWKGPAGITQEFGWPNSQRILNFKGIVQGLLASLRY